MDDFGAHRTGHCISFLSICILCLIIYNLDPPLYPTEKISHSVDLATAQKEMLPA